ncbi:uncharacterized protein LOC135926273 [Gordionus sp. m RMFG-2023]|uniref:uncharacterized protein LOC135926273 n=1 Tax=Gordionus sp. m RMFG-2023 TaxID=3053472 RepID=UPI0031FCB2BC
MMNSIPLLNNLSKELGRVLESSSLLRSDSNTSFAFTYPLCKDKLLETMVKCWEQIDQFYRENTKTSYSGRTTSDDLVTLSQMREAFVEYLVPHVIRAFNSIYPKHELEQILGISALKPFHMFPDTESMCQSIKDQVVKIR